MHVLIGISENLRNYLPGCLMHADAKPSKFLLPGYAVVNASRFFYAFAVRA